MKRTFDADGAVRAPRIAVKPQKPNFIARSNEYRPSTQFNATMVARHGRLYSYSLLVDEQVRRIRRRYASGAITQQELADEYHVSRGVIRDVVRGKTYKQVGDV